MILMGIALMQALPLWDASHYTGAWIIRRDAGSGSCRIILTDKFHDDISARGYEVTANPTCLKNIGLEGAAHWRTDPGGITIVTKTGKFMGSYSRANENMLKGWAPPNIKYTLTRAR